MRHPLPMKDQRTHCFSQIKMHCKANPTLHSHYLSAKYVAFRIARANYMILLCCDPTKTLSAICLLPIQQTPSLDFYILI